MDSFHLALGGQRSDLDSFVSSLPSHKVRRGYFAIFPLFKPNLTLQTADQNLGLPQLRSTVGGAAWFPALHDKGQLLFLQATDGSLEKSLPIHTHHYLIAQLFYFPSKTLQSAWNPHSGPGACVQEASGVWGTCPLSVCPPPFPCHPCPAPELTESPVRLGLMDALCSAGFRGSDRTVRWT